jgi:hypothetical protein
MAYDYVNPGDAAVQSFQGALDKQAQAARQKMIDEITQRREARLAQSDQLDNQIRQATLQEKAQQDKEREASNYIRDYLKTATMGDIPNSTSIARAKELGVDDILFRDDPGKTLGSAQISGGATLPGSGVPSSTAPAVRLAPPQVDPALPHSITNRGTDKEQADAAQKARLAPYVKIISTADPSSPEYRQAVLGYAQETGQNLTGVLLNGPKKPTPPELGSIGDYLTRVSGGHPENLTPAQIEAAWRKRAEDTRTPSAPTGGDTGSHVDDLASSGGLTKEGLVMEAIRTRESGVQPPVGRTKEGKVLYTAIVNMAAKLQRGPSGTWLLDGVPVASPSLAGAAADFGADKHSQQAVQANLDAASAFARTADDNAKLLNQIIKTVPETGIPFLNRPIRSSAQAFGDTTMSGLQAIRQSVQNEYARLIAQPNLTGVLSDTARKEAELILSPDATVDQIKEALRVLTLESRNRVQDYQKQVDEIRGRIKGDRVPAGGSTAPKPDSKAIMDSILKGLVGGQ